MYRFIILLAATALLGSALATAKTTSLAPNLHHLRLTDQREWSDFPAKPDGPRLSLRFRAERNDSEWCLRLRQQDVRQTWKVLLNGKELGRLREDENDTVIYLPVPPGRLVTEENRLLIEQVGKAADDIRVGEIALDDRPLSKALREASVEVTVLEEDLPGKPSPVPCRLTILNEQGALMTVGAASGGRLAVRPGVVYTGNGKAAFGAFPAGTYTVHAGRGFAYSLATSRFTVRPGDTIRKTLTIRREVPSIGHVSCDTHVHTLTYSGHGDCTLDERMLTIAGEGIDLPIAADHNRQIDYRTAAVKMGVRRYFTPVVGNEVTTSVGHFNIFPAPAGGPLPDHRRKDWKSVFESIQEKTGARAIILNHPRDLHSNFRPLGPERHLALTGTRLDGWELKANAMEVVNSGAHQTDVMRLVQDWMGLLNHGVILTPVGSSDSHDVSRYLIGQGRTYIRCNSDEPGKIDIEEAVTNFLKGRVLVSCGLLANITVNDKYGPGDLVPVKGEVKVSVRVLGPNWVTADKVELYANGHKAREARIAGGKKAGVKWKGEWLLPRPTHDLHLVAVATGPGVTGLHWPIARPYQPTSPVVRRRVIGLTGAVWLDGDGDGRRTSARGYAERLDREGKGDSARLLLALAGYDEAVAAQAADILRARGVRLMDKDVAKAGPHVLRAFRAYHEAWRESQIARENIKGGLR